MEKTLSKRNDTLDFMRAFAILCVLVAHTATRCTSTPTEALIGEWFTRFTCRCIPIFVFISGYLYRTRGADPPYLLRKIKRVAVPYLVFSIFALLFRHKADILQYIATQPLDLLGKIFWCDTFGIYYFVFVILYLYIMAFFAVKIFPERKQLLWFTAFLFVIHLLHGAFSLDLVDRFGLEKSYFAQIYFPYRLFLIWPFYFFAGMVFRMYRVGDYLRRNPVPVIAAWILVFAFCNWLFFKGMLPPVYNSIPGTMYSVTSIALLWLVQYRSGWARYLSDQSYYIYLCHIFFVFIFRDIAYHFQIQFPFWFTLFMFATVLFAPLILLVILKKIFREKVQLLFGAR